MLIIIKKRYGNLIDLVNLQSARQQVIHIRKTIILIFLTRKLRNCVSWSHSCVVAHSSRICTALVSPQMDSKEGKFSRVAVHITGGNRGKYAPIRRKNMLIRQKGLCVSGTEDDQQRQNAMSKGKASLRESWR